MINVDLSRRFKFVLFWTFVSLDLIFPSYHGILRRSRRALMLLIVPFRTVVVLVPVQLQRTVHRPQN